MKKTGSKIDSPYTPHSGTVPTPSSGQPGQYNQGPIGPKGDSGGIPLKFFDQSMPTPKPERSQ